MIIRISSSVMADKVRRDALKHRAKFIKGHSEDAAKISKIAKLVNSKLKERVRQLKRQEHLNNDEFVEFITLNYLLYPNYSIPEKYELQYKYLISKKDHKKILERKEDIEAEVLDKYNNMLIVKIQDIRRNLIDYCNRNPSIPDSKINEISQTVCDEICKDTTNFEGIDDYLITCPKRTHDDSTFTDDASSGTDSDDDYSDEGTIYF
jgi:hypothetical protein